MSLTLCLTTATIKRQRKGDTCDVMRQACNLAEIDVGGEKKRQLEKIETKQEKSEKLKIKIRSETSK